MKVCSNTKCAHVEKDLGALYCGKCGSEFIDDADIISGKITESRWGEGGVGSILEVDVGTSKGLRKDDIGRIIGSNNKTISEVRVSDALEDHSTIFVTEMIDTPTIMDQLAVQFIVAGKKEKKEQITLAKATRTQEIIDDAPKTRNLDASVVNEKSEKKASIYLVIFIMLNSIYIVPGNISLELIDYSFFLDMMLISFSVSVPFLVKAHVILRDTYTDYDISMHVSLLILIVSYMIFAFSDVYTFEYSKYDMYIAMVSVSIPVFLFSVTKLASNLATAHSKAFFTFSIFLHLFCYITVFRLWVNTI